MKVMDKAEVKSFGKPDEVREFPKGRLELTKVGGVTNRRAIFEPAGMVDIAEAACKNKEL